MKNKIHEKGFHCKINLRVVTLGSILYNIYMFVRDKNMADLFFKEFFFLTKVT